MAPSQGQGDMPDPASTPEKSTDVPVDLIENEKTWRKLNQPPLIYLEVISKRQLLLLVFVLLCSMSFLITNSLVLPLWVMDDHFSGGDYCYNVLKNDLDVYDGLTPAQQIGVNGTVSEWGPFVEAINLIDGFSCTLISNLDKLIPTNDTGLVSRTPLHLYRGSVWLSDFLTWWHPMLGKFILSVSVYPIRPVVQNVQYTALVFANKRRVGDTDKIFRLGVETRTVLFNCTKANKKCSRNIFAPSFLSCADCPGDISDFTNLWIMVNFHNADLLQPDLKANYLYEYSSDTPLNRVIYDAGGVSPDFLWLYGIMHGLFFLLSAVWVPYWIYTTVERDGPYPSTWLVERKWALAMVITAPLVGSNPIYFFLLIERLWTPPLLMAHDFILQISVAVLWFLWQCLMDGVRHKKSERSQLGLRFYWEKLLFLCVLVASAGLLLALQLARYYIDDEDLVAPVNKMFRVHKWVQTATFITYCAYLVLQGIRTHRLLRGLPYLGTRYRQLAFRFILIVQAANIVVVLVDVWIAADYLPDYINITNVKPRSGYETLTNVPTTFTMFSFISALLVTAVYLPPPPQLLDRIVPVTMSMAICEGSPFSLYTAQYLISFASHAYRDPPGTVNSKRGVLLTEKYNLKVVAFISEPATDTHALILQNGGRTVLTFRGTASTENAKTDLRTRFVPPCQAWVKRKTSQYPCVHVASQVKCTCQTPTPDAVGHSWDCKMDSLCRRNSLLVHQGFREAYVSIRGRVLDVLREMNPKPQHIFITGHSLGGALAIMMAYELADLDWAPKTTVYTFGCPRVGNRAFAEECDRRVPHLFRLVNDGDMVCGLPKFTWLGIVRPKYRYHHAGLQVVLDAYGHMIVNPSYPEKLLKTRTASRPANHMTASYRNAINACIRELLCEGQPNASTEEVDIAAGLKVCNNLMLTIAMVNPREEEEGTRSDRDILTQAVEQPAHQSIHRLQQAAYHSASTIFHSIATRSTSLTIARRSTGRGGGGGGGQNARATNETVTPSGYSLIETPRTPSENTNEGGIANDGVVGEGGLEISKLAKKRRPSEELVEFIRNLIGETPRDAPILSPSGQQQIEMDNMKTRKPIDLEGDGAGTEESSGGECLGNQP